MARLGEFARRSISVMTRQDSATVFEYKMDPHLGMDLVCFGTAQKRFDCCGTSRYPRL